MSDYSVPSLIGLVIAALIAFWVASDAKKRGMNGIGWGIGVLHHFFTDLPDCSQAIAGSARWISTASYCATPICSSTAGLRSTAERRAAAESDGTGCWPAQLLRQLRQQTSAQCQVLFRVRTHRLAL